MNHDISIVTILAAMRMGEININDLDAIDFGLLIEKIDKLLSIIEDGYQFHAAYIFNNKQPTWQEHKKLYQILETLENLGLVVKTGHSLLGQPEYEKNEEIW